MLTGQPERCFDFGFHGTRKQANDITCLMQAIIFAMFAGVRTGVGIRRPRTHDGSPHAPFRKAGAPDLISYTH